MRKRNGVYWGTLDSGPYETDILVILGGTPDDAADVFAEDLRRQGFEIPNMPPGMHDEGTQGFFISFTGIRDCAMWFPEPPSTPDHFGTVAHESLHVAAHVLARCGVQFETFGQVGEESVNDEPWAYFVGWLTRKIIVFSQEVQDDIKKQKKKTNAKSS